MKISSAHKKIIKHTLGTSVNIIAASMATIYHTPTSKSTTGWQIPIPPNKPTAIVLLMDRAVGGCLFVRLVDIEGASCPWSHELYYDFSYTAHTAPLNKDGSEGEGGGGYWWFEGDNGVIWAFSFVDSESLEGWCEVVDRKCAVLKSSSDDNDLRNSKSGGSSRLSLFTKRLFTRRRSGTKEAQPEDDSTINENDIGDPTDFQHLSHIGFNRAKGTFDIQNIPPELKIVFEKAGIGSEQLKDRNTASFIANFVDGAAGRGRMDNATRSSVADSSSVKSGGSRKSRGAPPPPPPKKTIRPPPSLHTPQTNKPKVNVRESTDRNDKKDSISNIINNNHTRSENSQQQQEGEKRDLPVIDPARAQLMASIRSTASTQILKPQRNSKQDNISVSSCASLSGSEDQSDIMASMLAKALAARKKKIAHSDEECGSGDSEEW